MAKRTQPTWTKVALLIIALALAYWLGMWPGDGEDGLAPAPTTAAPGPTTAVPAPTMAAPGPTSDSAVGEVWHVTRVIDGDTFDVERNGWKERVRMIGIDAPERDMCGYQEAKDALAGWIDGRDVVLVEGSHRDTDKYGRLTRYVEIDGYDVGLELIRDGWVVARYDSRSHQPHEREELYWETDDASPGFCG